MHRNHPFFLTFEVQRAGQPGRTFFAYACVLAPTREEALRTAGYRLQRQGMQGVQPLPGGCALEELSSALVPFQRELLRAARLKTQHAGTHACAFRYRASLATGAR